MRIKFTSRHNTDGQLGRLLPVGTRQQPVDDLVHQTVTTNGEDAVKVADLELADELGRSALAARVYIPPTEFSHRIIRILLPYC